jgi:hypothetical protein
MSRSGFNLNFQKNIFSPLVGSHRQRSSIVLFERYSRVGSGEARMVPATNPWNADCTEVRNGMLRNRS